MARLKFESNNRQGHKMLRETYCFVLLFFFFSLFFLLFLLLLLLLLLLLSKGRGRGGGEKGETLMAKLADWGALKEYQRWQTKAKAILCSTSVLTINSIHNNKKLQPEPLFLFFSYQLLISQWIDSALPWQHHGQHLWISFDGILLGFSGIFFSPLFFLAIQTVLKTVTMETASWSRFSWLPVRPLFSLLFMMNWNVVTIATVSSSDLFISVERFFEDSLRIR